MVFVGGILGGAGFGLAQDFNEAVGSERKM
jgi:hypothetical protein